MDISSDKYNSDGNQLDSVSVLLQTVRGFARRLIEFFVLTEEDRLKAGISVRGKEHDG
jgi:hypothetical protein